MLKIGRKRKFSFLSRITKHTGSIYEVVKTSECGCFAYSFDFFLCSDDLGGIEYMVDIGDLIGSLYCQI